MTIMRRAIGNLRRQDWTAVCVELAVVVLGVFLGVQAANWNEDREQDRKSVLATERLKDDLRVEAWNYEIQIGYNQQVLANARRAVDALTGKAPLSDEALLVAAYRATQFNGNSRRRATYDELTSTGEIGLIRDKALRTVAMDVYTQPQIDQIDQNGRESEYRRAFRMALPWQVQRGLLDKCGDHLVLPGDYAGIKAVLDYPLRERIRPRRRRNQCGDPEERLEIRRAVATSHCGRHHGPGEPDDLFRIHTRAAETPGTGKAVNRLVGTVPPAMP
jgi:hypothetical protein